MTFDLGGIERLGDELPKAHSCIADVSREEDVASMFASVDQGISAAWMYWSTTLGSQVPPGPVETLLLADWERTLAVNLTGQFLCIRQAVPRLRKGNDPSIINLSSVAGHLGMPGRAPYSASKWGIVGLTKTLAIELGGDGIRVNAVLPGAVDGPRIQAVIAAKAKALGQIGGRGHTDLHHTGRTWTHGYGTRYRQYGAVCGERLGRQRHRTRTRRGWLYPSAELTLSC